MNNIIIKNIKYCLSSILALVCILQSCTYDYFEDESNYVIYVPKADENVRTDIYKVDDVDLLIYSNESLQRQRHSVSPFDENARSRVGNFNFKLFPGQHYAYCFSNSSSVDFADTQSFKTSHFKLQQLTNGSYKEPGGILLDNKSPFIHFPGPVLTDTAWYERKYVGRICVAFKNMANLNPRLTYDNIKQIKVEAEGIGTMQYLYQITDSINTRSTRLSANDKMELTSKLLKNPYSGFDFGFENYFFPSLSETTNTTMVLNINFLDGNGASLYKISVGVVDRLNASEPMILHMNQTLVIKVDGNDVQIIELGDPQNWDSQIQEGGGSSPGETEHEI